MNSKAFIIIGAVIVVLGIGLALFVSNTRLFGWKETPIVEAISNGSSCSSKSTNDIHHYYYVVDGRTYRTSGCGDWPQSVTYLPAYPNVSFVDGFNSYHIISIIFILLGSILVGIPTVWDRNKARQKQTTPKTKRLDR